MQIPDLAGFRLAGGTALALQIGHRTSDDLDFFSGSPFDNDKILMSLEAALYPERPENIRTYPFGFFCSIHNLKCDFMYWGHEFVEQLVIKDDIRMASPLEILLMKLQATSSRRTRKDYVDIALLLNEYSLHSTIALFEKKYAEYDPAAIIKQLTYFDEAENTAQPRMLIPLSWEEVKLKINRAVKSYWEGGLKV